MTDAFSCQRDAPQGQDCSSQTLLISGHKPRWGSTPRRTKLTDCQSQCGSDSVQKLIHI
jgi:hypothetical protein